MIKKFNVTFKENKKYNPATRTIMVETYNATNARDLIINNFGSWSKDKETCHPKCSKRIEIIKVKEVIESK